jgi:hypothetical protein
MHIPTSNKSLFKKTVIYVNNLCTVSPLHHIIQPAITTIPLTVLIFALKDSNSASNFYLFGIEITTSMDRAILLGLFFVWIALLKVTGQWINNYAQKSEIPQENYLLGLISVLDTVVQEKVKRFRSCLDDPEINKNNMFDKITQPDKQLNYLIDAVVGVFEQVIPGRSIRVSLLEVKDNVPTKIMSWSPLHPAPTANIELLSKRESTAMHCIETKSLVIIENTKTEVKQQQNAHYAVESLKDTEERSILCYPIYNSINREIAYVINIVVDEPDTLKKEYSQIYSFILQKIVNRMELEHLLKLLKDKSNV